MKKLILLCLLLFSFDLLANGLSDSWTSARETVSSSFSSEKSCPVYASTPMSQVKRKPWELEFGYNFFLFPGNGPIQAKLNSWGLEVLHNLSSVFGAYARYDLINYEKWDYDNSEYESEWSIYIISGGFHLYLTPVIRIFGGFGKVFAKDKEEEEPDLETSVEYGVKYDIPLDGYKLVLFFKTVEARLATDDPTIEESTGAQSYSAMGASLAIPFGQ